MAFACALQAPDVPSQSLLLRGAQVWFHRVLLRQKRTSVACRIAREVSNVALVTQRGDNLQMQECPYFRASYKENFSSSFAAYKASTGMHVLHHKDGEGEWRIFEAFALLCALPHIDALRATAWVRATVLFVFVSFVLGIRAASASQAHHSHIPLVSSTCSLKISDVEVKNSAISSEADVEHGKASEPGANDNVQSMNLRRQLQNDQGHTLHGYNQVAYDGANDRIFKKFADTFVEGEMTQQACAVSPVPYMMSTVNKSSGANGAIREWRDKAEDQVLGKEFQEWGSACCKLTVPLRVVSLRGSVPPIWIKDFILSQGKRVKIRFESQGGLEEILSALDSALKKKQVTPRSILSADIVTVGDSWLQTAVSGRLIQPIENVEQHEWFNRIGPKLQAFLRRDQDGCLDPEGLIWGVPYRWGSMVIAFRTDKLSKNNIPGIEDWSDLWKPELTGKIAMVDSSREVVGAVLKSLGASYNAQNFDKDVKGGRAAIKRQFLALQKQVKVFDSVHYLKALSSEDVWVAVGWSSDVIPVAKRMSNIRVVAPKSGASVWVDLWAIPAANSIPSSKIGSRVYGASPLVHEWFDFCLQPARGVPFKQGVFVGASPLYGFEEDCEVTDGNQRPTDDISGRAMEDSYLAARSRTNGPAMDTNMIEGMPPQDSLEKSEVLEPLSEKALADYRWLFSQVAERGSFKEGMLRVVEQFFKPVSQ